MCVWCMQVGVEHVCVEHACVWQCMSCVDAHVCTCTHLLDRLISDILYGPLSLRSLTELNTGSASYENLPVSSSPAPGLHTSITPALHLTFT